MWTEVNSIKKTSSSCDSAHNRYRTSQNLIVTKSNAKKKLKLLLFLGVKYV